MFRNADIIPGVSEIEFHDAEIILPTWEMPPERAERRPQRCRDYPAPA